MTERAQEAKGKPPDAFGELLEIGSKRLLTRCSDTSRIDVSEFWFREADKKHGREEEVRKT